MRARSKLRGTTTGSGGGGGTAPVAPGDRDIGWNTDANARDRVSITGALKSNGQATDDINLELTLGEGANADDPLRATLAATWLSNASANDKLAPNLTLCDDADAGDDLGDIAATFKEGVQAEDNQRMGLDIAGFREPCNAADAAFAVATNLVGMEDSYVDADDAGTNFDGNDLLLRPAITLAQDETDLIVQLDMTGWSGFNIDIVTLNLTVQETATAATLNTSAELRNVPSKPFAESTVDYDDYRSNQGTLIGAVATTFSSNGALGGNNTKLINWSRATYPSMSDLVGDWLYIIVTPSPLVTQLTTMTMYSAETGSGSERPRIELTASR